jgi:hypothetical protein
MLAGDSVGVDWGVGFPTDFSGRFGGNTTVEPIGEEVLSLTAHADVVSSRMTRTIKTTYFLIILPANHFRIERVAEGITDQIKGQHKQKQGHPRKDHNPPVGIESWDPIARVTEQLAPIGIPLISS